jgi:alpha-tubulin suppressor-like RCC1 family protein
MKIRIYTLIQILLLVIAFQLPGVSVAKSEGGQVLSVTIWDTAKNKAVRELHNNDVINVATLSRFSLVAKTSPTRGVPSVVFSYQNNPRYRIENVYPYSISSDRHGMIIPWDYGTLGDKTISVGLYSKPGGVGVRTSLKSYRFSIVSHPEANCTPAPSPDQFLRNVQMVGVRADHTCALKSDGLIKCWGNNGHGKLGDGTTDSKLIPAKIAGTDKWHSVSAGWSHTLAIRNDSTLWGWGADDSGEFGEPSRDRLTPTQIGADTKWRTISAGAFYNLAIKKDGTLWAWGTNYEGELGDGTTSTRRELPVQIGGATKWSYVAAGTSHSAAIKDDGTLWAWGRNTEGQLGDGTTDDRTIPTQIGCASNWSRVTTGVSHTIALRDDGTLWAWGANDSGQLGDGTTDFRIIPTQVGNSTNWYSVSAGWDYSAAIKDDGTLWAWGSNANGQLGDGATVARRTPVRIGGSTDWSSVGAGVNNTVGIKNNGEVWAWGSNLFGQLGDGTTTARLAPVQVLAGTP